MTPVDFDKFSNTDLILLIAHMKEIDGSATGDYLKSEARKDLYARLHYDQDRNEIPKRELVNIPSRY